MQCMTNCQFINQTIKRNTGKFHYSTLGIHVISEIIARTCRFSMLDFANTYLFEPLDIEKCVNNGKYNRKRIIAESWITQMLMSHSSTEINSQKMKYGYLWWIIDAENKIYAAIGDSGNFRDGSFKSLLTR